MRIVGVASESASAERRVALTPRFVPALTDLSLEVLVERGAGERAGFDDAAYRARGARICASRDELFRNAELMLQVRTLPADPVHGPEDLSRLRAGQILVGYAQPFRHQELLEAVAAKGVWLFAMELVPRVSRAQPMDSLSSMATLAGYKAILLAADLLPKIFPMLVTAAGTIPPARVLVIGAGVAGLQAIATARRLGARVKGYDLRPAAREEVLSLGAEFVDVDATPAESGSELESAEGYAREQSEAFYRGQRRALARAVAESDVVVTTAAVPGRPAPVLVTRAMVESMAPGSVVVDLAADSGGNCEYSQPDEPVVASGVTVLAPTDLPSRLAFDASEMYARNLSRFVQHLLEHLPLERAGDDSILGPMLLAGGGQLSSRVTFSKPIGERGSDD